MEGQLQLSENAGAEPAPAGEFHESWNPDQSPSETPAEFSEEAPIEVEMPVMDAVESFEEPLNLDSLPEETPEEMMENEVVPTAGSQDLSEVSTFSNSNMETGPLSYSVLIENIDTKEIRQQLAEALADSKFQWDAKELLKKIKMGKLQLESIHPVKASVLIHRLQSLPVKVSWVQNVYS